MDATDIGFKLLVENILQHVKEPEHRHIVIETLIIISTVLKRNPESQVGSFFVVVGIYAWKFSELSI